jgi:hypothetical protein
MSKKPESRRQLRTRRLLQQEVGGKWYKIWGGPFQQAGIPDLIGCVQGLFFAFEIKEPNGVSSELQDDEIEEIIEAGGCAAIITEPTDAVKLVVVTLRKAGKSSPIRR